MESLSKFALNNQIVSMRHVVRKSKVHTINKLSRESKKLKNRKGNEEQINKNIKKSERIVNEIMQMKKLNDDMVTKYALQNETPIADILNKVNITIETRALARLAGHKFIIDAVKNFRKKYPDWKLSMNDLLNDLGTKYRAKKKPNQNKSTKIKKDIKNKISEKSPSVDLDDKNIILSDKSLCTEEYKINVTECHSSKEKNVLVDKVNHNEKAELITMKNTNLTKHVVVSENPKSTTNKNNNTSDDNNSNDFENNFVDENSDCLSENTAYDSSINSSEERSCSETFEIPVLPEVGNTNISYQDHNLKRVSDLIKNESKKRRNIEEIEPICQSVDSFFMTTDDKEYKSVYIPLPPSLEKLSMSEPSKIEYKNTPKDIFIKGKKVTNNRQKPFGNRRERRQQIEDPVETVLHPSWEAKRKQKSLAKFEGKKITFDDND